MRRRGSCARRTFRRTVDLDGSAGNDASMKPTVYVETTIVSYLTARKSRNPITLGQQEATRLWWATAAEQFDLCVSQLVIDEAAKGDRAAAEKRLLLLCWSSDCRNERSCFPARRAIAGSKSTAKKGRRRCFASFSRSSTWRRILADLELPASCECIRHSLSAHHTS